jgi:hypothetical protein
MPALYIITAKPNSYLEIYTQKVKLYWRKYYTSIPAVRL